MINKSIKNRIRICLRSYDDKQLAKVVEDFIRAIKLSGGLFSGPVRLPNEKRLTTLQTSPHVYKTALEQFKLETHKIILDVSCGPNTLNALKELNISGGVEIQIKVSNDKKGQK
jgi:small subunit ribosomal protein S10